MKRYFLLVALIAILSGRACGSGLATDKLTILISANESSTATTSQLSTNWSMDGHFVKPSKRFLTDVTVDSDYSRTESSTLDHLKTTTRLIDVRKDAQWRPLLVLETEGDHEGQKSLEVLGAIGLRHQDKWGFIELSFGASKNTRSAEPWSGDIGCEFAYDRSFGDRWRVHAGPKGDFGAIGSARLRNDRFRYSWNLNVDYKVSGKVSLGYRLWYGNTVPSARRTQWLGITINVK